MKALSPLSSGCATVYDLKNLECALKKSKPKSGGGGGGGYKQSLVGTAPLVPRGDDTAVFRNCIIQVWPLIFKKCLKPCLKIFLRLKLTFFEHL